MPSNSLFLAVPKSDCVSPVDHLFIWTDIGAYEAEYLISFGLGEYKADQGTADYCVELGFDEEVQGQQVDFRPRLPMMISW